MLRPTPNKNFIEALIKSNLVTEEKIINSVSQVQLTNESLTSVLIKSNLLTASQIINILSEEFDMDVVDLKSKDIDASVVNYVPIKFASFYKFMPLEVSSGKVLLASSEPIDLRIQDEIRVHLGLQPKVVLAPLDQIEEALKKYYGLASEMLGNLFDKDPNKKEDEIVFEDVQSIETEDDDASITQLVNQILLEAVQKRATDIHIEPYRNKLRLRYRIDGGLVDANLSSDAIHVLPSILSRIKIMANLSITEKRLPQDGSAVVKTKEQSLDLRISTIPTPRGESMVIRILPSGTTLLNLEKLGFNKTNASRFREIITRPHGVVFVTGPTGSGKTTTLYACLNEINSSQHKIITIEDPIEYEMEGITQIQVNTAIDFNFATGLRSVLRHDPDILMVGEVRDLETAEIAIRTALTGHLVFSTLHTNDAASGVTRLIDMGVEPYLVASSVQAFIAQRLVRVICPECKEEDSNLTDEIKREIQKSLNLSSSDEVKIYKGKGCDCCNQTGYLGRTAIYEILELSDDIKEMSLSKPRAEDIKTLAIKNGMHTLRQDGWLNVLQGITTPEEVLNTTMKEQNQAFIQETTKPVDIKNIQKGVQIDIDKLAKTLQDKELATQQNKNPAKSKDNSDSTPRVYEFRSYVRADQEVGFSYQLTKLEDDRPNFLQAVGDPVSAQTKNISAGGLQFGSKESLSVGDLIELEVNLQDKKDPLECLAKVARVEKDPFSNNFLVAVYYLDISLTYRDRLNSFVKKQLANVVE